MQLHTQKVPCDCALEAEDIGRDSILISGIEVYMDKVMNWSD